MMRREDFINYLENNHAFTDSSKIHLTSGITRILKKNPEILDQMKEFTKCESEDPSEIIYRIINPDFNNHCQICGKETLFKKYYIGYALTCSSRCAHLLSNQKGKISKLEKYGSSNYNNTEKRKQTCLEKYGTENYVNLEKRKKTNLERYGVEYANNVEKGKRTSLEKYGVENAMQSEEVKDKLKNTNLSKYGVEYGMQSEIVKQHFRKNCKERTGKDWYSQTEEVKEKKKASQTKRVLEFEEKYNCIERYKLIETYGQSWLSLDLPYKRDGKFLFYSNEYLPTIKRCFEDSKNNISSGEIEVLEFCGSLLLNEEIISNYRGLIKSKEGSSLELDIYIPSKKLAIEYNGIYWHSLKDKNYHLHKTEECEKQRIRLIHIWEDLWFSKKEIYKSIISSALGMYSRKIYARNCECKEISPKEYKEFLNENHLQGPVNSSLRLGLFYNNELIQVAGWGKSRFKKDEFELHRMCSKLNTQIIGGFSKLIKHSNLNNFISFIDRDLYNGKSYQEVGFTFLSYIKPGYFYCNSKSERINRVSAQKHKLSKFLPKYNESLTEVENMEANGYYKVYDCGNIKVKYEN